MWYGTYSPKWRAFEVDRFTWRDGAEIGAVRSLDVANDIDSETLQDGSLRVDGSRPGGFVRLYLEAVGEGVERVPVGTFSAETHVRTLEYSMEASETVLESLLVPAMEKPLPVGWFAPKGADPVRYAAEIIRDAVKAPVRNVRSDLRTESTLVAESGETALSFAREILDGTGYRIDVSELGEITVTNERSTHEVNASMVFDSIKDDDTETRTVTLRMPFDPRIRIGDLLDFKLWEQRVYGLFEVRNMRVTDACEMEVTAVAYG